MIAMCGALKVNNLSIIFPNKLILKLSSAMIWFENGLQSIEIEISMKINPIHAKPLLYPSQKQNYRCKSITIVAKPSN